MKPMKKVRQDLECSLRVKKRKKDEELREILAPKFGCSTNY